MMAQKLQVVLEDMNQSFDVWHSNYVAIKSFLSNLTYTRMKLSRLKGLSLDDMLDLTAMKHSDVFVKLEDDEHLVNRAIQAFGSIPQGPLHRGVSQEECESILESNRSILAYSMSFSEDPDVCLKFDPYDVVTIRRSFKPLFDLESFYNAFICALQDLGVMDAVPYFSKDASRLETIPEHHALLNWLKYEEIRKPVDITIDTYEPYSTPFSYEFEWIVPRSTKFTKTSNSNLAFDIL